jgi:hypothetical protein
MHFIIGFFILCLIVASPPLRMAAFYIVGTFAGLLMAAWALTALFH